MTSCLLKLDFFISRGKVEVIRSLVRKYRLFAKTAKERKAIEKELLKKTKMCPKPLYQAFLA